MATVQYCRQERIVSNSMFAWLICPHLLAGSLGFAYHCMVMLYLLIIRRLSLGMGPTSSRTAAGSVCRYGHSKAHFIADRLVAARASFKSKFQSIAFGDRFRIRLICRRDSQRLWLSRLQIKRQLPCGCRTEAAALRQVGRELRRVIKSFSPNGGPRPFGELGYRLDKTPLTDRVYRSIAFNRPVAGRA